MLSSEGTACRRCSECEGAHHWCTEIVSDDGVGVVDVRAG